jgi:hypothetical protein
MIMSMRFHYHSYMFSADSEKFNWCEIGNLTAVTWH